MSLILTGGGNSTVSTTSDLATVLAIGKLANSQIKSLIDPTDAQDADTLTARENAFTSRTITVADDNLRLGQSQQLQIALLNNGLGFFGFPPTTQPVIDPDSLTLARDLHAGLLSLGLISEP